MLEEELPCSREGSRFRRGLVGLRHVAIIQWDSAQGISKYLETLSGAKSLPLSSNRQPLREIREELGDLGVAYQPGQAQWSLPGFVLPQWVGTAAAQNLDQSAAPLRVEHRCP